MGALVAFVTWLLAVVAEALGRGADLSVMANVAAFVAGTTRKGRHCQWVSVRTERMQLFCKKEWSVELFWK